MIFEFSFLIIWTSFQQTRQRAAENFVAPDKDDAAPAKDTDQTRLLMDDEEDDGSDLKGSKTDVC